MEEQKPKRFKLTLKNSAKILIALVVIQVVINVYFVFNINIEINSLKGEIDDLKVKNAEIDTLKTRVAEIDILLANSGSFGSVQTGACPEGYCPGISFGDSGTYQGCLPC